MGDKKRKKKVPEPAKQRGRIPHQDSLSLDKVCFHFQYENWMKAYSDKKFTNFLKDSEMYAEYITKIFSFLIPKITHEWSPKNNSYRGFRHCHQISDGRAYDKYKKAIKSLHNVEIDQLELWQFGINGSYRLICEFSGGIIYPLLIDYHHLGYDNKHHNQDDYKQYDFCPVSKYIK